MLGSPPRVRGTGAAHYAQIYPERITPACAGNRLRYRCMSGMVGDHPRVCGEQAYAGVSGSWQMGSPPRVRGTEIKIESYKSGNRITPACAGNSRHHLLGQPYSQDHPRVCGEQQTGPLLYRSFGGSPPRVRGTVAGGVDVCAPCGITPACAGNRLRSLSVVHAAKDHPRVCGEQWQATRKPTRWAGSPPRVRGTAAVLYASSAYFRITPACAGNSRCRRGSE